MAAAVAGTNAFGQVGDKSRFGSLLNSNLLLVLSIGTLFMMSDPVSNDVQKFGMLKTFYEA